MTYEQQIWTEFHANRFSRAWRDVLLILAGYARRSPGGVAWPAHATLAARAKCSVRTVQRALQAARRLGLVEWTPVWIRASWRALRASNRYILRGLAITGHHGWGMKSKQEERGIGMPPPGFAARVAAKFALERAARHACKRSDSPKYSP